MSLIIYSQNVVLLHLSLDLNKPFSLQDCHIKTHSSTGEPVVDTSQDYVLLSGSENATHTILRFRRKLNTCDDKSDVPITVRENSLVLRCRLLECRTEKDRFVRPRKNGQEITTNDVIKGDN